MSKELIDLLAILETVAMIAARNTVSADVRIECLGQYSASLYMAPYQIQKAIAEVKKYASEQPK